MNALFALIALAVAAPAPDTVVVCPRAFQKTLEPWIDYRQAQGHVITVVSNDGTASDIRTRIRELAKRGSLKHVLLVGDAPSPGANDTSLCIPAHYVPSKVTLRWGSEPLIATDNFYADLDDDLTPDLAIGRLPADSPAELTAMINKIIAYEQNGDFGAWRTRVNFVAGSGGFGLLADKLLERVAASVITQNVPVTYASSMTYACWQSAFCPHPRRFQKTVLDRMNEGCAFWIYIGHGSERDVAGDSLSQDFRWDSIFSVRDVAHIKPQGGPAIALFLACRTGAYDKQQDCLAEELLRANDGPVAVMSGSRVTMPMAMTVLGLGLISETFDHRRPTLGEVFLHAKRSLKPPATARRVGLATIVAASKGFERLPEDVMPLSEGLAALRLIRAIGTMPADLMQERAEHVSLFNLFGDPLLRIRYPDPIELHVPTRATGGDEIQIVGELKPLSPGRGPKAPSRPSAVASVSTTTSTLALALAQPPRLAAGAARPQVRIEILPSRDRMTSAAAARQQFDPSDAALAAYDATYQSANDGVISTTKAPVENGQFRTSIRLPADCRGHCQVRAVLESPSEFAAGATDFEAVGKED
jgi:Peptidase family C25